MTHIAIPDELAERLAASAAERGCDQDDLACLLLEQSLRSEDYYARLPMTPELEARLVRSVEAGRQGQIIPGHTVDAWFDDLIEELGSR